MTPDTLTKIINTAAKLKKVMLKKNLRRARAKCPFCALRDDVPEGKGYLHGALAPQRRSPVGFHLHMKCDGPCKTMYME